MSEVLNRREHIRDLLSKVGAMVPEGWSKDDRVDLILFQSQLAGADFFGRQLDPESSNPQIYVDACANAIFSLLKNAAHARPRRDRSPRADAGNAADRPHQPDEAGEAVRLTRDRRGTRGG
jgi:hypothetical protein